MNIRFASISMCVCLVVFLAINPTESVLAADSGPQPGEQLDAQRVCVGNLSGRIRAVSGRRRCYAWEHEDYLAKAFSELCPCFDFEDLQALAAEVGDDLVCDNDPRNRAFLLIDWTTQGKASRALVNWGKYQTCQYKLNSGAEPRVQKGLTPGQLRSCEWLIADALESENIMYCDDVK